MDKKLEKIMLDVPKNGFHFDEPSHKYFLDGAPLTGVTTVLGVIAKPSLIQWAADEAVKFLGWYDKRYVDENEKLVQTLLESQHKLIGAMDKNTYFEFLGQARVQHAKRKKAAGDVGKYAHTWIENWVKAKINGGALPARDPVVGHMTDHFVKWAEDNNANFVASEVKVYSRKYWFGGTFDIICEIKGELFIVDIKTGGGIYAEHFYQMGGYDIATREMIESEGLTINGKTIDRIGGYIVLNLKKSGEFDKREYFNLPLCKDAFLAALTIYRANESLKIK